MSESTPTAREQFRIDLLLHLPELGLRVAHADTRADIPSHIFPKHDMNDSFLPDTDYDLEALAAWILAEFDREHAQAAAAVEAAENVAAEVVEMAGASAVITSSVEFASYLSQLSDALKQNLGIAQQWDLARAIGDEEGRLLQLAAQLVARYPALTQSLPAEFQSVAGEALASE